MNILNRIKVAIGLSYSKKDMKFDSSRIREGEMKHISKDEIIVNKDGRLQYCKKNSKGKWVCKKTPLLAK